MNKKIEAHLHEFAITDGLLKGTAIVSNLITIASISILPGFGAKGLFIANTIQMTSAGILEIPTGIFADRFGWSKSVLLALYLKLFVTLAFLFAIIAANFDNNLLIWLFISSEAIIDSFASTFLSGSYQAAFLHWYQKRAALEGLELNEVPPLFLSSFKFAQKIRFTLPFAVLSIVMLLHFICREAKLINPYFVAYTSIGIIILLRILVIQKVKSKLPLEDDQHTRSKHFPSLNSLISFLKNSYFPLYVSSVFINLFAVFYLVGRVFKLFNQTGISTSLVWVSGVTFGLTIYLVRTLLSVLIFPRLGLIRSKTGISICSFLLGIHCLFSGYLLTTQLSFIFEFLILLSMAVFSSVISDAIQRYIDSHLSGFVEKSLRATWLSTANAVGFLLFGFTSLVIMAFKIETYLIPVFCMVIFVLTVFSSVKFILLPRNDSDTKSFSNILLGTFLKGLFGILAVISCTDIFSFVYNAVESTAKHEKATAEFVRDSVMDPLSHGAFLEASSRLESLKAQGIVYCSNLKIWDYSKEDCQSSTDPNKWITHYFPKLAIGGGQGELQVSFDRDDLIKKILSRIQLTFVLLSICSLIVIVLWFRVSKTLSAELSKLVTLLDSREGSRDNKSRIREFEQLHRSIEKIFEDKIENRKKEVQIKLAAQVSHDIRSPLSALEITISTLTNISEEKRVIIRNATSRIRDIANSLLLKKKGALQVNENQYSQIEDTKSSFTESFAEEYQIHLISPILESIATEIRIQYRDLINVAVDFNLESKGYGLFARIQSNEFKRIISNLVNNAVESINRNKSGKVSITLELSNSKIEVSIIDNGEGIPSNIIHKLGDEGFSYNKENGSGLGLSHAKATLKRWNGDLHIHSEVGEGTKITCIIPNQPAPEWFVPKLVLKRNMKIVIFDDDQTIHQIWHDRFKFLNILKYNIEIHNISTPNELRKFYGINFENMDPILFLMDFEILNHQESGLSLIEELGIQQNAILVTSHFEDPLIRSRCETQNVKLIPKPMSGFVPIMVALE